MSKEIYISTTPHETRLAIVENDALTEIYYERENEYTLAGSVYNGRVTRVLPGMQSAFVDVGLERDAFLYITDFMEELPDSAEFDTSSAGEPRAPRLGAGAAAAPPAQERTGERGSRSRRGGRDRDRAAAPGVAEPAQPVAADPYADSGADLGQPLAEAAEAPPSADGDSEGSRRWRGRRGRRRGGRSVAPEAADGARLDQPGTVTEAGLEGETLYEGGTHFEDPAGYDLGASADLEAAAHLDPASDFDAASDLDAAPSAPQSLPRARSESPQHTQEAAPAERTPREGQRREGRRESGRSDRNRRGREVRDTRGSDARPPESSDYGSEARPDQRGDRGQRPPRGFAPSRDLYGVDEGDTAATRGLAAEPIVLPGESLSKYRKPSDSASDQPASAASPASAAPVVLAPPANLYALAAGWDGGDVLPGETLSRRRAAEPRASQPEPDRRSRFERGPRREGQPEAQRERQRDGQRENRREEIRDLQPTPPSELPLPLPLAPPAQFESAATRTSDSSPVGGAFAEHPQIASIQTPAHASPADAAPAPVPANAAAPTEPAEYEPTDAAVSYRVDPLAPAEFRHSSPTLEPPVEAEAGSAPAEEQSHYQAADVAPDHHPASSTHSITPAPGEHFAPLYTETAAPVSEPWRSRSQTATPVSEPAAPVHPEPLAEAHTPAFESHDVTSISPTGDMHSHLETFDAPVEVANAADHAPAIAPSSAALHQEEFEEEEEEQEPHGATLHASSFEELDDLDDETLEGAADLGTMLREMSIDSITRVSPDGGDDLEDDFIEDDLEDDFDGGAEEGSHEQMREEAEEEAALHEHDSVDHAFTESSTGRTSFDTGAHADESPAYGTAASEPAFDVPGVPDYPSTTPRRGDRTDDRRGGRRDGRRDGRRGRGDRPRTGSPSAPGERSGRGRQSMQSTNLPAISDLLKPGQEILVQIAKEPIAKKGARITSHIALPGRFLVFMPTVNHTGVSRKIESDGERRRLKEILLSEKGDASGGFIVRTAASGATEEELRSDLRFLLNLWSDIKTRSDSSKSPALIYHDLNLIERILRDQVTDTFSAIWVDSETEYERVLRFLQRFQPSLIRRVKLYTKELPLFEQFGITEEINKALRSKVWLKSGGSIVINQTEALVAIDINTGKYVGKTARLEDTIVKTNLDAIPEIVRQIRLRDLGGIIIIDFIDMDERKNRNRVMAALEEELKSDRAPSKVLQFNDFGLVAITRKRVKQSLERTLSTQCNVCQGTGMVKSPVTICNDIYVEMRKMHKHLERGDVMLRVHPEVVKQLKASGSHWLQEMEEMAGKTILVKSDPSLHPEQFDIH